MDKHNLRRRNWSRWMIVLAILALLLTACQGTPEPSTYIIGVASEFPAEEILDEFKSTMTGFRICGRREYYLYLPRHFGRRTTRNEAESRS